MSVSAFPFTVIIPVYNRPAALARALGSLARQAVRPVEVIVVDDASIPRLRLSDFEKPELNLRIVPHDVNRGPAAARNTGMREARTRWVTFLDSDDCLLPQTLHKRVEPIAARESGEAPSRVIYGCGWNETDERGNVLATRIPKPAADGVLFSTGCWFAPGSCIFIDRCTAIDAVGYQDEDIRRFEDFDWFLSLGRAGFTLEILPVVGASVERRRIQDPDKVQAIVGAIREKWAKQADAGMRASIKAYLELELASACWFSGRKAAAFTHLAKSFYARPRRSLHLSPGWK